VLNDSPPDIVVKPDNEVVCTVLPMLMYISSVDDDAPVELVASICEPNLAFNL